MDGSRYDDTDAGLLEWAMDLEDRKGRIIKQNLLWNGLFVSTIWTGLDMSFLKGAPPLIFETMVFDQLTGHLGDDIDCARYSTLEEAQLGHRWYMQEYGGFFRTLRRFFNEALEEWKCA